MPTAPADTQSPPANGEPRTGSDLIDALAAPKPEVTGQEAKAALDWLLSDDPEDNAAATKALRLNVGGPTTERWVEWTIQAVEEGVIRRILRSGAQPRRRGGGGDEGADANLQIVTAGTLAPDLKGAAAAKNIPDPSLVVRMKFKKKPGLIGQIADEIMALSGFDEGDVRDAREVSAAGN